MALLHSGLPVRQRLAHREPAAGPSPDDGPQTAHWSPFPSSSPAHPSARSHRAPGSALPQRQYLRPHNPSPAGIHPSLALTHQNRQYPAARPQSHGQPDNGPDCNPHSSHQTHATNRSLHEPAGLAVSPGHHQPDRTPDAKQPPPAPMAQSAAIIRQP